MRTLLRRTALAAAILLIVAAAAAWLAVATAPGLRWTVGLAQRLAGGTLTVGAVQGRALDAFVLERLRYAGSDGTVVEARRLVLRIRLDELPQHRLHIEMARAEGLRVRLPPAAVPATGSVRLPTALPLDLLVDSLGVDGLKLVQGVRGGADEPVIASDRAGLAGRWIGDRIEIARLDLALAGTGALTATARGRMRADRIEVAALKIAGPGEVQASGTYGVGAVPTDLRLQWSRLQWPLNRPDAWLSGATGQGRLRGRL
ncbi:MAG: hypothetical protein ISP90_01475, partial [Nevskia sp.]|nr:hypothetical protein [Nevskia sp.]